MSGDLSSDDKTSSDYFQQMVEGLGDMGPMGKGIVKKALKKQGISPKNVSPEDFEKKKVREHIVDSLSMFLGEEGARKKYLKILKSMR